MNPPRVAGPLAGYRLGLVHGQMRADEKDDVMRRFKSGEYQVLVSTTVIEVGIDVPNATVMVIEAAEQGVSLNQWVVQKLVDRPPVVDW